LCSKPHFTDILAVKGVGAISYIHQIHNFGHGAIAEGGHANDKLDHGFEREFSFTQCDGISQRQRL
jgi:hypothetical protein